MITIILGNTKCKMIGLRDTNLIKELDDELSYTVQGYQFVKFKNNWDGRQRLFTKSHCFPIGLLSRVEKIIKSYNYTYEIKDNRDLIEYGDPLDLDPNSGFEIRDYQQEVVDLARQKGSGIIRMATGAGKSLVISMMAARFNVKTVIYVIGIELLYQMKDTLNRAYPDLKVGMVGDGHCDIQQITVATIWSTANAFGKKAALLDNDLTAYSEKKDKSSNSDKDRIRKMVQDAQLFILDECQYASSDTVKLLHQESISAQHRFLLSGTPWREDGTDILIEAVGGPRFFNLDASTLIKNGWLVPPNIHLIPVPVIRSAGKNYQEVYKNYIVENEDRNALILKAAKKLVDSKKKVLILVTRISHGEKILSMLEDDLRIKSLDGSDNSEDRMQTIKDLKDGKIDVIIASRIFDQGIDIPELDALILAGSGKSSGRALQRIGRVIRKFAGKKNAIVVDFLDNCRYLKEHSKARLEIYRTEPEFKIILPKG